MKYAVSDICKDVRVVLDMDEDSTPLIAEGDVDSLSLDDIIRSKITDAVTFIEKAAPLHMLDNGLAIDTKLNWNKSEGLGEGYLVLPDDFMRLISFRMTDWQRPAEIIYEDDPRYALQSSPFVGIKGNPECPVAAICQYPVGLVLEFYSCIGGAGTKIRAARYLALPEIDEEDDVVICEKLKQAVVYYIAALVCSTYGNAQMSQVLMNTSFTLAELPTTSNVQTNE